MKYSTQNSEIKAQEIITSTEEISSISTSHKLPPLPLQRPLLLIGHGTRDADGKETF